MADFCCVRFAKTKMAKMAQVDIDADAYAGQQNLEMKREDICYVTFKCTLVTLKTCWEICSVMETYRIDTS